MGLPRLPLLIALLLTTASAAFAQLTFERNPKKDPYRNLFAEPDRDEKARLPERVISREASRKPFVVCGTLIVPVDPRIDPKIRAGPPNDGVDYKIRTLTPRMCKPE